MEPNNRAAVSHYKSFLKSLEKIQSLNRTEKKSAFINTLNTMEFALKNIKKVEPNYDTSALEHHVLSYKSEHLSDDSSKKLEKAISELNNHISALTSKKNISSNSNLANVDEAVRLSTLFVEKQLEIFKTNFPDYKTIDFEQKLNKYKEDYKNELLQLNKNNSVSKEFFILFEALVYENNHIYFPTILDEEEKSRYDEQARLMLTRDDIIPENEAIKRFEKIILDKQAQINEFINSEDFKYIQDNSTSSDVRVQHITSKINSIRIHFQKEYSSPSEILKVGDLHLEKCIDFLMENYYSLQLNSIISSFLSKVFNQDELLAHISQAYQDVLVKYGSIQEYKTRILNNKKEYNSEVFMPKSFGSDYEKDEITKKAIELENWQDEIVKIVQLNSDFYFEKEAHKTFRVFNSAIAKKNNDGICHVIEVNIKQEFLGSKYGEPMLSETKKEIIKEQNIYR